MFRFRFKVLLFLMIFIITPRMMGRDRYQIFGAYHAGLVNPSGNLGQLSEISSKLALKRGWNIGFDGVYPFNSQVGLGFDLLYSLFPIDASGYDGNYKILSIKPSLYFGSFDPNNQFLVAGFIGGGYSLLITPQHTYTTNYGYTYTSSSNSEVGLGIGGGFLCGYRLSESLGISGTVAYDNLILVGSGNSGGSYLSFKIGLLVTVMEDL